METIEPEIVNPLDFQSSQLRNRTSWHDYAKKFSDQGTGMHSAVTNFQSQLDIAAKDGSNHAAALAKLSEEYKGAKASFEDVADLKKNGWVKKSSASQETFDKLKAALVEKENTFENFLSGKEKYTFKDTKETVEINGTLKNLFEAAKSSVDKVSGVMDSIFGMARVDGLKEAIEHNAKGLQFWKSEVAKGRGSEIAMRGGSTIIGSALVLDAVARGKSRDDECRSVVGRVIEGATGILLAGGGLALGHAR